MHNVLISIVCIKHGGGVKALYPSILYQPINLFTYFYLHTVQNSFIHNTDYKLGHKPILIWRSTHDTEL